jgi:fructose-1,6-bisphosphatase/inositol monophosphatase family enzyme
MISYLDYIERLNELDIKLYDFQKRISYFRLSNLQSEKLVQTGGASKSIIYQIDKPQLENIILKLLAKEYDGADILCEHFCFPKNK